MKNPKKWSSMPAIAIVTAIICAATIASPAAATTTEGGTQSTGPTVSLPELGLTIPLDSLPDIDGEDARPVNQSGVTPYLNPIVIGLCNAGFGDAVIGTWDAVQLGDIDLKCGDGSSGYVHIRSNHQSDWQSLIDWAGGGANWDDLMAFSLEGSLTAPAAGLPSYAGSNKWCYSTPLVVTKSNGQTSTWNPTVVVSENNARVITAYPTRTDEC